MDASLEEYEEMLRARDDELQARAEASVAAADAAIRQKGLAKGVDMMSLVQQNIQDMLEEMDDAPELGISKDSIDAIEAVGENGMSETLWTPLAIENGRIIQSAHERQQEGLHPSERRSSSGGVVRRSSEGGGRLVSEDATETTSSELDVPGHVPATVRLHKAKVRALEQDVAALKAMVQDKDKKITSYQHQVRELMAEKAKWQKEKKALETEAAKAKRNVDAMKADIAQKDATIKEMHHAASACAGARETRSGEAEQRAREVRLNRALEEVEKYKQLLEEVKSNEREGNQVAKSDYNRVVSENKKLERQKQELVVAFKKQMKLIDVLRRQKLHMEAARQIAFTEEEFLRTLDVGP